MTVASTIQVAVFNDYILYRKVANVEERQANTLNTSYYSITVITSRQSNVREVAN